MNRSQYVNKEAKDGQVEMVYLWRIFVQNLWKIALVAFLVAALFGSFRYLTTEPYYTSNVKFLISGMRLASIDGEYTYISDGSYGSTGGAVFAINAPYIIGEDNTIEKVRVHLAEKDPARYGNLTNRMIRSMIEISVNEQVITVSVSNADMQTAMDVADSFRDMVPGQMDYFYGMENSYTSNKGNESADETGDVPSDEVYENVKSVAKALNTVSEEGTYRTGRGSVLYALLGALLGAATVYIICFARTYYDHTVYSEEDLKTYFALPVVGQIPSWNNAVVEAYGSNAETASASGLPKKAKPSAKRKDRNLSDRDYARRLLNSNTPFAITEAFKSLRTNMCYTTKGEKCPVYGITSAYVQAGKSLVIANLAVSFSMMDKKVLLLDGDLRCPVQHKIFGIDNHVHGFSDLLAGICTYETVQLRDGGYPNLSILTCGKLPPNPAELLASANMKSFIERAKQDYDFIFIDLPPVSEVSDAGIISELVTGYAFVVRSAYSDRRMVETALQSMEGFAASLTGFILNDIDIKSGSYYKNKYYNYGRYGKYSRYSKYGKYAKYSAAGRYGGLGDYSGAYSQAAAAARATSAGDTHTTD